MRKIITTFILLTSIAVYGQDHYLGMVGGACLTNVKSDNFSGGTNRKGLLGGLTYEYKFKKIFHVGLDFVYAQRGFKNDVFNTDQNENTTGEELTLEVNYDYLSLPIKGGFSIGSSFSGFLNLGVVPSLLINTESFISEMEVTIKGTDEVSNFDFGGLIEIGGSYQFKEHFLLFASFAYQYSFTSLSNSNYYPYGATKHYGMILTMGLRYALKKE